MISKEHIDISHQTYWMTCLMSNYAVCCNYFTKIGIGQYFDDYFKEFNNDFADPLSFFTNRYLKGFLNYPLFAIHYHTQFGSFLNDYANYLSGLIDINYLMERYAPIFTIQFHIRTSQGFIPYITNQSSNMGGYPFLKLLHDNINKTNFIECREIVNVVDITKDDKGIFPTNDFGFKCGHDLIEYMRNEEVIINAYDSINSHSLTVYCDSNTNSFFIHNTNEPDKDKQVDDNWIDSYSHFLIYERKNSQHLIV